MSEQEIDDGMDAAGAGAEAKPTANAAARAGQQNPEPTVEHGEKGGKTGEIVRVMLAHAEVTPAQARALVVLSQGGNLAEASAAAQVDRGTLYRWRNCDRNFMAALNAWRQEQQAAARDALLSLSGQAIKAVVTGLEQGDARLGLRVLDKLGSAQIGPTEPTHPRQIFGPGIGDEEVDRLWAELRSAIMELPEERRGGVAAIIRDALRVEERWGRDLLAGLAASRQHRELDADQSTRAGAMIMAQIRNEAAARALAGRGAL